MTASTSRRDASLRAWLQRRQSAWQALEEAIEASRGRSRPSPAQAEALVTGYRALGRDLALAREALSDGPILAQLQRLYQDAHHCLHRPTRPRGRQLLILYRDEVPAAAARLLPALAAVVALFLLAAFSGYWLVYQYPELATLFASEEMINQVQQGRLWTDDLLNVVPSSLLSLGIMTNNIVVSLTAFVFGAAYGLGTLYIIGLNGLMLGAIFAFTAAHGLDDNLLRFVLAHGVAELSIICIAGAAGVGLGEALARPGDRDRATAFREAVAEGGRLLCVCVPFLVGCGLIEGYVSPDPAPSLQFRLLLGVSFALLLFLSLAGYPWRLFRSRPEDADG